MAINERGEVRDESRKKKEAGWERRGEDPETEGNYPRLHRLPAVVQRTRGWGQLIPLSY